MLEKAKLLILDGVGLALAAAREDFAQKTMKAMRAFGQGSDATVVGFKDKLPVTSAPLLNGMLIHAFDFDDTHHPLVIHNTSVVMPAALATSEWLGLSGKDFITACAVGFEVSLRVARGPRVHAMHGRGYHPTAVCGVFGGAAAAGRLLGLSHDQLVYALGPRRQSGFGKHGVAVGRQLVETFSARLGVPWRSRGRAFGARGFHSPAHCPGGAEGVLRNSCRRGEF